MKARALIQNAAYSPDKLKTLFKAFDEAWHELAPQLGADAMAVEAARVKLASIVLSLASTNGNDPDHLKKAALRIMRT